jgi:hypothetical protein
MAEDNFKHCTSPCDTSGKARFTGDCTSHQDGPVLPEEKLSEPPSRVVSATGVCLLGPRESGGGIPGDVYGHDIITIFLHISAMGCTRIRKGRFCT